MKNARIILILGLWVAVLPYLGFPYSWKKILFTISGIVLMYMAYIFYKIYKKEDGFAKPKVVDNFSENSNFEEKKEI